MKNSDHNHVSTTMFKEAMHKVDLSFDRVDNEIKGLHKKIDDSVERLATGHLRLEERVTRIEETMATKTDINVVLDRIDHLTKTVEVFGRNDLYQNFRIKELENCTGDHEKRLTALERPRQA
jgi:hypothetical protein